MRASVSNSWEGYESADGNGGARGDLAAQQVTIPTVFTLPYSLWFLIWQLLGILYPAIGVKLFPRPFPGMDDPKPFP